MPFECGKLHIQTAASLARPKTPQELRGWYNGHEENCAPPNSSVTAAVILWWIWHTYWSYAERWRTCGAVHERTLRHDWHECLTLQSYDLFQGVPPTDSDRWVAWVLFYALVILYS